MHSLRSVLNNFRVIASILCATSATLCVHAREAPLEVTYRGVQLVALPSRTEAYYDVNVIGADQAIERIRMALDLIEEKSSYGSAAFGKLRKSGPVIIVYDPSFPRGGASSAGTLLAAFVPDLDVGDDSSTRKYPILVGRFIVKWTTEGLASTLVHELVHGIQHMNGRLGASNRLDTECEASLYQEGALQDVGANKRSEQVVGLRRTLQLHSCVPFIQYMKAHTPSKLDLWNTLNPDIPQLLTIYEEYLRSN